MEKPSFESMDFYEMEIKKEEETLELEDTNENYLKLDFEIGVKVENDSPALDNWCLQNGDYQEAMVHEVVKEEGCDVNTCFICFRMFADSYSLYKHNITHMVVLMEPPNLYQCSYCLCYWTSKEEIGEHIKMKHYLNLIQQGPVSKRKHQCSICKKVYSYKTWHEHMRQVHGTEKFQCVECNVTFKCKKYLHRHLLYIHQNVRPNWRFRNVKIEPVQEFKCDLCPSVFQNKNSRKTHIRNCHSSEVHECTVCHSKLKSKPYLRTHMKRVHYDDGKLHKCDICSKVFRSPRYLNIHKKNSHGVRVKPKRNYQQRKYELEFSDSMESR